MIYLTYNDQPTGVYFSQVTDVCNFVNKEFNCNLRLVALISIRKFGVNKRKIKAHCPKAIVLPMFPKNKNWRRNTILLTILFLFIGKQNIWSRGLFATNIALELKRKGKTQKIVFDARGAYKAEFDEYLNKIVSVTENISQLENNAVVNSDYRISVSNSLIKYWENNYNFSSKNYSVIPCTLGKDTSQTFPIEAKLNEIKRELEITENDVVFIYSGSSADWQSLNLVDDFMLNCFANTTNAKLILLSNIKIEELKIYKEYEQKISQHWVKPEEVMKYLFACDYGILIRERSITNEVASPTKFAEYLNAGLKILISEKIGDFSTFVKNNNCGEIILENNKTYKFESVTYSEKEKNNKLANDYFSKRKFIAEYKKIIALLS